ncbi:MAG: hypothetical protein KDI42_05845 [Gammaproteobacteria bacterium]|nr:hypothetical protein [Gammaproteobacteria bacterium]
MFRRLGTTLLLLSLTSMAQALPTDPERTFVGQIVTIEETGLGPYDGLSIKDTASGEILYFLIEQGRFADIAPGLAIPPDRFEVRYRIHSTPEIVRMTLNTKPGQCADPAKSCIEGQYLSGEIGDMGAYIHLRDAQGHEQTYRGQFDIDAGNSALFGAKAVVLEYETRIENQLIDLLPTDNGAGNTGPTDQDTSSIVGQITDISRPLAGQSIRITVENDNELIEAELPPELARQFTIENLDQVTRSQVNLSYGSKAQLVLIAYAFDTPELQEARTDDEAIERYRHLLTDADAGRFVASRTEDNQVYIEIETASGQILENVLVPTALGLSDARRYQDKEMTFTYVFRYENVVTSIARQR